MPERLRRLLPSADAVRANRWLRWLGPALHHPRLWHLSRRGIALGVGLGLFFGFLVPIAQIPLSAASAILLRANVPCAIASTLITNPVTFGPVYFAAWKVGSRVLGEDVRRAPPVATAAAPGPWWHTLRERVVGVGKPLAVGLAIFAVVAGLGAYLLVTWAWWARTVWLRRRRLARRASRRLP
jgi:uncharacterized protein (DUF2062 family)